MFRIKLSSESRASVLIVKPEKAQLWWQSNRRQSQNQQSYHFSHYYHYCYGHTCLVVVIVIVIVIVINIIIIIFSIIIIVMVILVSSSSCRSIWFLSSQGKSINVVKVHILTMTKTLEKTPVFRPKKSDTILKTTDPNNSPAMYTECITAFKCFLSQIRSHW